MWYEFARNVVYILSFESFIVDYVCPFSAKLANAINTVLVPLFAKGGKYDGKVKVIFRNQVQPWHASSTWVHEAGLAVGVEAPIS